MRKSSTRSGHSLSNADHESDSNNMISDSQNLVRERGAVKRNSASSSTKTTKKDNWTHSEDSVLLDFVAQFGPKNWHVLALKLPGRVGKQCRERWLNHLDPTLKKDPWTIDEDLLLERLQSEMGNHWKEISLKIPGRSENSVKNRWHVVSRRKVRKRKQMKESEMLQQFLNRRNKKEHSGVAPSDPNTVYSSSTAFPTNTLARAGAQKLPRLNSILCTESSVATATAAAVPPVRRIQPARGQKLSSILNPCTSSSSSDSERQSKRRNNKM